MNERCSNKITNINLILTIMIVFIHSSCARFIDLTGNTTVATIYKITGVILPYSVGLFFFISAFLLYRNIENYNDVFKKIKKRFFSLVIPYLIWSILFFFYYLLLNKTGIIYSKNYVDLNVSESIYLVLWKGTFHTSWFIRNLIIYVSFAPVVYTLLKKKWSSFLILAILIALEFLIGFEYSSVFEWLPIYTVGAICGIHYKKYIEEQNVSDLKNFMASIFILATITVLCYLDIKQTRIYFMQHFLAPIFVYIALSYSKFIYRKPLKLSVSTFLITITHTAIIQIINNSVIKILGITPVLSLVYSLFSGIIAIVIIYLLYIFMQKYFKNVLKILTGNR